MIDNAINESTVMEDFVEKESVAERSFRALESESTPFEDE